MKRIAPRIAFGCEARVGKDTACDFLQGKYPAIRLTFAGALYDILGHAQRVCGFPIIKDRKFLQWVGTEWARAINQDVWIDIVKKEILEVGDDTAIIITDVRFPNEAEMLRSMGFTLVRIKRDLESTEVMNRTHASEIGLLDFTWDVVIKNNGDLESFFAKIDGLYKSLI